MSKSLGNVIDPLDIVYGASLPVINYCHVQRSYRVIKNCIVINSNLGFGKSIRN